MSGESFLSWFYHLLVTSDKLIGFSEPLFCNRMACVLGTVRGGQPEPAKVASGFPGPPSCSSPFPLCGGHIQPCQIELFPTSWETDFRCSKLTCLYLGVPPKRKTLLGSVSSCQKGFGSAGLRGCPLAHLLVAGQGAQQLAGQLVAEEQLQH